MPPKECGERHDATALSYSTASLSVGISVTTIILNGLIILVYIKNHKNLFKRLFYKITFNIILADFLNGLIADNLTLSYVIKEGLEDPIAGMHVTMSHITFFIFGTVSVGTIGILGIERQWAVLFPFSYRVGVRAKYVAMTMTFTWIFSISLSLLYLLVGFYTSLVIFASTTVTLSFIILIVTASVYYLRLIRRPAHIGNGERNRASPFHLSPKLHLFGNDTMKAGAKANELPLDQIVNSSKATNSFINPNNEILNGNLNYATKRTEQNTSPIVQANAVEKGDNCLEMKPVQRPRIVKSHSIRHRSFTTEVEKRATATFMIILVVYIISYLPTCIMMIYMNTCKSCDCLVLHVLRDMTYLSMVSSCLLRPISFIFSLKPLRDGIKSIFRWCGRA